MYHKRAYGDTPTAVTIIDGSSDSFDYGEQVKMKFEDVATQGVEICKEIFEMTHFWLLCSKIHLAIGYSHQGLYMGFTLSVAQGKKGAYTPNVLQVVVTRPSHLPVHRNGLQLSSGFPEMPTLLLYISAPSVFGETHSSLILRQ